ncbi:MAG TPA: ABC transporter substrate binding protein [Candidatus Binatia bacterium]
MGWFRRSSANFAKIGWIRGGTGSSAAVAYSRDLFKRELSQLGYIEGKNITIEYRSAENQLERFPALVQELIGLKVDVIVSSSTAGALAAKNATQTIPSFHRRDGSDRRRLGRQPGAPRPQTSQGLPRLALS